MFQDSRLLATTPCTRRAFQYHSTVRLQAPRLCPKGLLTVLPWRFSRQSSSDSAPFQRVKNSAYLAGPDFCLAMHNGRNTAQRLVRRRSEEHTSELQSLMRISY